MLEVLGFHSKSKVNCKQKRDFISNFMEIDCDEIDRLFLPANAFRDAIITPILDIAPPQGSPFLDKTSSMEKILRKMPRPYR